MIFVYGVNQKKNYLLIFHTMEQIVKIVGFVLGSFLHIWPYLLVTIPLAVVVNLSGASRYITSAFGKNPLLSVFLATVIGAFSPFCSCGVIPVISSLLIGGVPLGPVMSFWIASPSMDPEIFFLSCSVIGWKLAVWRLAATFLISLLAGYITHYATIKGFIGNDFLRKQNQVKSNITISSFINSLRSVFKGKKANIEAVTVTPSSSDNIYYAVPIDIMAEESCCCVKAEVTACNCKDAYEDSCKNEPLLRWKRISGEILKATLMITKFMGFAFLITALITFYMPEDVIKLIVELNPAAQVILATLIGIPMYTSNITALPIAGGLIELGLNKGAALSFLIAGATTTLPAIVAVWGITKKRVFLLYLSFALFGALVTGLCYNLFSL